MFKELEKINQKPKAFEFYNAQNLWTDEHTAKQMLRFHLNENVDISSRKISFIDKSVAWIASYFKLDENTKIADFGCGPGLYTSRLAKISSNVTGIDFSKNSLAYAKDFAAGNNLKINYISQNYLEFDTEEQFDLIIMIMCDFCALSPSQRKELLLKFNKLLTAGGAVLLDFYSLDAFKKREEKSIYEKNLLNGFWSPNDYYGFLNVFKYDDEKVVLDKYTIIEPDKIKIIYNWLQYFDLEDLKKEFEQAGFKIKNKYSDVAGSKLKKDSDELAVVAIKS